MRFLCVWGIRAMNILIVGNGFDLSHYLPTKYDHFMVAMDAIENWDEWSDEINFDDIFGTLYEKEGYFFGYTKSIYKTEKIKFSSAKIENLKQKLESNVWYKYFSEHYNKLDTWIDFEQKINEALNQILRLIEIYNKSRERVSLLENLICEYKSDEFEIINLPNDLLRKLSYLGILETHDNFSCAFWGGIEPQEKWKFSKDYIISDDSDYDEGMNILDLRVNEIFKTLSDQLEDFSELFSFYLNNIVCNLKPKKKFKKIGIGVNTEIYSFNYTNILKSYYFLDNKISFLHGSLEKSNIILGVADISDKLREYKPYQFVKYAQKILKETDYKFLEESKLIQEIYDEAKYSSGYEEYYVDPQDVKIAIWGHSLDQSDSNYIKELFSLNNEKINAFITIYVHNKNAKKDMLYNLFNILGQSEVEKWMKKGWLKFEPNPDIAKLNNIEPVELPKLAEA